MQDPCETSVGPPAQSRADADPHEGATANPPRAVGRVLLLEDDPAFQEVIRDFLAENGYTVVPVKNGGEGVAQVLNGDFALVLCDLNMPGLPGDMFYRAVERIRPDLCSRFVFMTGFRGDTKLNEYIKAIGCWVLRKPFPLEDLLALFAFTAERSALKTICDWEQMPGTPREAPASGGAPIPQTVAPAAPKPEYPAEPLSGVRPHVPLATSTTPVCWLGDVPEASSPGRKTSRWVDVCAILAVVLGFQYLDENNEAAAGLAELRTLQAEWAQIEPEFERASAQRAQLAETKTAEETTNRADLRWISTAQKIALAINPSIELVDLRAREIQDRPGACEVHLRGVARGEEPRRVAERFRHAIEESISAEVDGRGVTVAFQRLEEIRPVSGTAERAEFTILVTASPNRAVAMFKKGEQ